MSMEIECICGDDLTSDQGVAGSSPARCVLLSTVSLRALYTLFDNNQTVMEAEQTVFSCAKTRSATI